MSHAHNCDLVPDVTPGAQASPGTGSTQPQRKEPAMSTTDADELGQLRAEVAELRGLIDELTSGNAALTVRRLAVSDGLGERIVLFANTMGEARVDVMLAPDSGTTASLFAEPGDGGATVGAALWTQGNHLASLAAVDTRQPHSDNCTVWTGELHIEHSPERFVTDLVTVGVDGLKQSRSDLRNVELPFRRRDETDGSQ